MSILSHTLGASALMLASIALQATDFEPLMRVAQSTWPEKHHLGVVCDYRYSRDEVEALAQAAGVGTLITVADIRSGEHVGRAKGALKNRHADFLVLLPRDRFVKDGSIYGTLLVRRLAMDGTPTIGTTPRSIQQGAVFCVGEGTNGEVLVNDKLIGTIDVILPNSMASLRKAAMPLTQGARVDVMSIR